MASKDQVIEQIRYGLSQLPAKNGHHQFEELTRHVARARIASNILPATGPVSAGGDQARDFETFNTYIQKELPPRSAFMALAQEESIVFICTLQADDVPTKIRQDIAKLLDGKTPPDAVYAFCEANIPVAKRHELQEEAQEKGIRLEVIDGTGIAEMLADRDVFWIAERYLALPADLYPREDPPAEEQWYEDVLKAWAGDRKPQLTPGDFQELKRAVRHATFTPNVAQDLPRWIELLRAFTTPESPGLLSRAAFYEIGVASLRGLGNLEEIEPGLADYMSGVTDLDDAVQLQDTQVLLTYLGGAHARGLLSVGSDVLEGWRDLVRGRCESLLDSGPTRPDRCQLMECIALLDVPFEPATPDGFRPEELDAAFEWWFKLVADVPDVPLFPIRRMAQYLAPVAPVLGIHRRYRELMTAIDELVAARAGREAAAALCRDRAMSFREAGQLVPALREFHQAKADWFAGDTVRGTLLSMALIGRCYEELGLQYAAKRYYVGGAWMALQAGGGAHSDLARPMLIAAATATYEHGAWFWFLDWAQAALRGHSVLAADWQDLEAHDDVPPLLYYLSVVAVYSDDIDPKVTDDIKALCDDLGLWPLVEETAKAFKENTEGARSAEAVCAELQAPPFADGGDHRTVQFSALGLDFTIGFENTYHRTLAAERFTAALQVVLAELADRDLAFLRTTIAIEIEDADGSQTAIEPHPSNSGRRWTVRLTPFDEAANTPTVRDADTEALGAIAGILSDVSLLPDEQYQAEIERLFEEGISHKVGSGNLYDRTAAEFVSQGSYDSHDRSRFPADASCPEAPSSHAQLGWNSGPGPTYSAERATEFITNRYERIGKALAKLLPDLAKGQQFRTTFRSLRDEGWPDWQILMAVFNTAINFLLNQALPGGPSGGIPDPQRMRELEEELATGVQIPHSLFGEEHLRFARTVSTQSTVKIWGLESRQATPDIPAIQEFLDARYRNSTDDVPHDDVLAVAPEL